MLAWATGLHGGQEAENQPSPTRGELLQASSACSPPTPVTFLDFVPSWCQHLLLQLWLLLCCHLETSLHLYINSSTLCSSGKAYGGFAQISCINITLTVSASKLMAVTGEKAKSSWKCKMALTQPQMLWLAGIEVGKSLI